MNLFTALYDALMSQGAQLGIIILAILGGMMLVANAAAALKGMWSPYRLIFLLPVALLLVKALGVERNLDWIFLRKTNVDEVGFAVLILVIGALIFDRLGGSWRIFSMSLWGRKRDQELFGKMKTAAFQPDLNAIRNEVRNPRALQGDVTDIATDKRIRRDDSLG